MLVLIVVTLFPIYSVVRTSLLPGTPCSPIPARLPSTVTWTTTASFGFFDTATAQKMGGTGLNFNFLKYLSNTILVAGLHRGDAGAVFRRRRFCIRASALPVPKAAVRSLSGRHDGARDHDDHPQLHPRKRIGLAEHLPGHHGPEPAAVPVYSVLSRQFFIGISRELRRRPISTAPASSGCSSRSLPLSVRLSAPLDHHLHQRCNDYMWPLLVGSADKVRLLTVALGIFRQQTPQTGPDWAD